MKYLWLFISTICFISTSVFANTPPNKPDQIQEKLETLEKIFDGKIGIYAMNTHNHQVIAYRADELFPVQSTFKLIGVAALLKKSEADKNLLQEKINYTKDDLVFWHPVTGQYIDSGMTVAALAEAAISYSDSTAINLIMKKLGGPKVITDFANSIGNKTLNIQHYEANLNSDPKNKEDSATPKDMAISVQKLTLGNVLSPAKQKQLVTWMKNNTTGDKRIRAGVPTGWVVADKTGSGDYGVANDIGIAWSVVCQPVVLAIYTVQNKRDSKSRDDVVASATRLILDAFAKNDACF